MSRVSQLRAMPMPMFSSLSLSSSSSSPSTLLRTFFSTPSSAFSSSTRFVSRTFHVHPPSLPRSPFTFNHPIMHHSFPKATASYSTGGSAEDGREILVQHLLVKEDDQKLLLDIQQRISAGEDLSDLAVEYSICPSKEEGGMLGWVRKGQMVPEFEEAAFNAPRNKVVRCKTKFGWHLLQVLSEREESLLLDIQPDELHAKIQDPNFLEEAQLIDVREPGEVAKASLPGFKVLPLRQFGSWGPEITTKFDPKKDTYVIVSKFDMSTSSLVFLAERSVHVAIGIFGLLLLLLPYKFGRLSSWRAVITSCQMVEVSGF